VSERERESLRRRLFAAGGVGVGKKMRIELEFLERKYIYMCS